jgi:hypothetical protein
MEVKINKEAICLDADGKQCEKIRVEVYITCTNDETFLAWRGVEHETANKHAKGVDAYLAKVTKELAKMIRKAMKKQGLTERK